MVHETAAHESHWNCLFRSVVLPHLELACPDQEVLWHAG